jgi:PPOX class probable F420-dependent enzyme
MDLDGALDFARNQRRGVLATVRRNGRPQLSNVLYQVLDEGALHLSITADRAKYHNLTREPWAALHVTRDDFWAYVVLEGDVELVPVADAQSPVVDALVEHYRTVVGEPEDLDGFRRAQVDERRVLVRFLPTRAYGMANLPG